MIWCGVAIVNRQIIYNQLLANRLHGQAAELHNKNYV